MSDLSTEPWASFADLLAQELIEHGATEAAVVTRNESENRVVTNYYNCGFEEKCVLIGHMFVDLVMETVNRNIEEIRGWLEEDGDT